MSNKEKASLVPKLRFREFRDAGGWTQKPLGDIGEIVTGKTPSTSDESLWNGEIQFVTPTDISEEKYQWETQRSVSSHAVAKVLPKHSTMFTCIASIGKMALSVKPCITNQQINSIVPSTDFEPEFVYYSLLSIVSLIKSTQSNSTLPIINKTDFSKIPISISKQFAEQQKIADCLSSLDELIAAQARKVDALKTHKKGLMQQLFPREGETQPRLQFPEFQNAGEWKQVALGQLMTIKGRIGYRGYTVEDIVEAGEGAISLSPSNISAAGTLSFEKATYISWAKFYESPEIILEKNFTVLVKTGSTYGKVAFIWDLPHECTINPQIVVFKPTSTNPCFLYLLISGELIQSRIEATVVGGAIPTLSQENISKFVVCVPSEAEQQRIADCLTALDDLITTAIQDIETLKTHKKGLMQQLFPSVDAVEA